MFGKRFWMFVTFAGVIVSIGGLIATIALTVETGEERPDSECSTTMRAGTLALSCFTSDDPKVLLGVGPLLLGFAMIGIGIWRWIAASSAASASGGGGGGLMGSIQSLQQQAMEAMQSSSASTASMGTPAPPPATPPASTPAPPPTPPSPPAPGE